MTKRHLRFSLFLDYFLYLVVRTLEEILNLIPEKAAHAVGRLVGRIVYVLFPDRRSAAIENLFIAFGREKSREWIARTARKSFEHMGMAAVEFFRIRRWNQGDMVEKITIRGALPYNLTMMPGNHGVCILTSHFGCFEVGAAVAKLLGWRVHLIVTGLRNPFLSRYLFHRGGERTGIKTYPHRGIVNEMIHLLRSNEMVAFLADQRGDAERGVFVDYFGTKAPANEVFARFAIEGEARVMPLATYRRDDGRYQVIFEEDIPIQLTGDMQKDLVTVSQQFHTQFEEWLRLKPEQGFWLQRKWRRKRSRKRSTRSRVKQLADRDDLARGEGAPISPNRG
jgi:KDO2-lipid IV(A) lauroyltransferase